ncbi:LysE family translocator [Neisseriaceae bacterium B1]
MGSSDVRVVPRPWVLFHTGVMVSLSNPKAILFFAALFPKFLNRSAPLLPQYAILTASFFVIETFWQRIYTGSGKALAAWLNQSKRLLYLNRLCGTIFIFLATGLLWDIVRAFQAA